jgi:hypothetical protein
MMSDRSDQAVDELLARAAQLDDAALLQLAAGESSRAVLDAARRRAGAMIRRRAMEADLDRADGRMVAWSFASVPRLISSPASGAPRQEFAADLRERAAPAIRDAVLAMMLGPALDESDRDLLLAQWRAATDHA